MNAQKARAAVEDMAVHYGALSDAKEDCKTQVDARMELLVAESETPITKEDCNILYQLRPESGKYTVTATNYAVTNGGEVAGGVNSFFVNKG